MSRYSFNQIDLVLDHLKRKGHITTWEAFELYGITRLCTYSTYTLEANNDEA